MRIGFKLINGIVRLTLNYTGLMTNGYKSEYTFYFPSRISTIFLHINRILGNYESYLIKDELGILKSQDRVKDNVSRILAIGVGKGLSLIHNVKTNPQLVRYTVIEGSKEQIGCAKRNAILNSVPDEKYEIIYGYAGSIDSIYGKPQNDLVKYDINSFEYDVLELDCEGSEIDIINELTYLPRFLIIEFHPMFRKMNYDSIISTLKRKSYSTKFAYTIEGEEISLSNCRDFFTEARVLHLIENKTYGKNLIVITFESQVN